MLYLLMQIVSLNLDSLIKRQARQDSEVQEGSKKFKC